MAEFSDVIYTIQRICKRRNGNCSMCILGEFACPNNARFDKTDEAAFRELEDVVIKWAAENPEPVYPSYIEVFGWAHKKTWAEIKDILANPIPADIAQKLGIKPKEAR